VLLCLPDVNGKTATETVFEDSEELYEHDLLGFYPDYAQLYGLIVKLQNVYDYDYWNMDYGNYKVNNDFYDTAAALSADLKAAGIDEFTEELNRQYNEWKADG
jgi:hypothetical protein